MLWFNAYVRKNLIFLGIDDWLYVRDEWLCETISVTRDDITVLFPVYSYIDHEYEIMDGKGKYSKLKFLNHTLILIFI